MLKIILKAALFLVIAVKAHSFQVGLVLDKGGKDDKSFNGAAYEGIQRAKKELGIDFKYVEATDTQSIEFLHRSYAKKNMDLIIGIGFAQADAVKKVAAQFPNSKFAIVDGDIQGPNIKALLFEEHEGSYLVGALAAMKSKTGVVGFVGGMDIPLIRRFELAYKAGAEKINPKIKVLSQFIGVTGEAWNNPPKAKELALSQLNSNADVLFAAAGASGVGVFDAVQDKNKLAIGVDSNQNWMRPGFILTSMLKRVDVAVFETVKQAKEGSFKAGTERFGLKNKGVDYSKDEHNDKLLDSKTIERIENLKKEIIAGKIIVPDFYKK